MFTWTLISLCFIAHYDVSSGQDRVEQSSEEMTASEGAQVIVWCKYITTDTNPYLFWYQKLPNRSPTFILNKLTFGEGTTEPDFKKRFSATLNSTSKTVPLMIKNLCVSDSAVYYCALRPTVTGNTRTLISNSCISAKYCPILTNHKSMESLFISFHMMYKSQF
uniref:Ig-like domain-containing protein n=1 Tax=Sinocyclocheilus rhinocerous TaxID=307959 RepID=A0A673LYE4_9TELE